MDFCNFTEDRVVAIVGEGEKGVARHGGGGERSYQRYMVYSMVLTTPTPCTPLFGSSKPPTRPPR